MIFFLRNRQPPRCTRNGHVFPYTPLFRSRGLRAPVFARSTSPPADRSTLRIDRRDRSETRAAVCRRGFQRLVAARQSAPAVLRLAGSFHERARSSRSLVSGGLAADRKSTRLNSSH